MTAKPLTTAEEHAETIREFIRKQEEPSDFALDALARLEKEIVRLRRGLEGMKDWAARSGTTGLEQWCLEALSPTGALAVFPPTLAPSINEMEEESATLYGERHELTEQVKALADALEKHARQVTCPGCDGVGSRTCSTCDHGEKPTHHPDVIAALRLAGRL